MIITIIPFFLLASVPEDPALQNGLEYKFSLPVDVKLLGLNGSLIHGFNATNDLSCRLKDDNILKCKFYHEKLLAYKFNAETGEMIIKDLGGPDSLETLPFELEYDNTGPKKILLPGEIKTSIGQTVVKVIANLLNIGMNLSNLDNEPLELNEMNSFMINTCMANLVASYSDDEKSEKGNWKLDFMPPMTKLSQRRLQIKKSWNTENCANLDKFFWLNLVADFSSDEIKEMGKFEGRMSISSDQFDSQTEINYRYTSEDKNVSISEITRLLLVDIQPAQDAWPEFENPKTLIINNDERKTQ